jgi:UDP-N-acetylglucosamine/UDP-N-acetylgalactosamine 4-epimerase
MIRISFASVREQLRAQPKRWLVTGAAGFIASNLVEELLGLGQYVVGLDNFSTGHRRNLDLIRAGVTAVQWGRFRFVEGDIVDPDLCAKVCIGVDVVLHQAALGSVPGSIDHPEKAHESNVTGLLNMLAAARREGVKRFVYASSCAIYGDTQQLPLREDMPPRCLSPYATTKLFNEGYAEVWNRCYGLDTVGLRYFNVFGPRQDPNGAYAAVIPRWISAMILNQPVQINGDGETSRDFCYVANVVQANLLAATCSNPEGLNQVYNVAASARTTLNELFEALRTRLAAVFPHLKNAKPIYQDFRAGDVRHSQADISKALRLLGYQPSHTLETGLDEALHWYRNQAI